MGSGDGVVRVLAAVNVGPPVAGDLGARGDLDDGRVDVAGLAARQVGRVYVFDGEVGLGGAEAGQLALVVAVDGDALVGDSQYLQIIEFVR